MLKKEVDPNSPSPALEDKQFQISRQSDSNDDIMFLLIMRYLDIFFTFIFSIEMLLKWMGLGIKNYFKNPWCLLDFFIVVIAVLSITFEAGENAVEDKVRQSGLPWNATTVKNFIFDAEFGVDFSIDGSSSSSSSTTKRHIFLQEVEKTTVASEPTESTTIYEEPIPEFDLKSQKLKMLRVLRAFRALRPLRAMSKVSGIKIVTDALICSIPSILNVLLILLLFWLVFAIVGINMFRKKFYRCIWFDDNDIKYGSKQLYHTDDIWDVSLGEVGDGKALTLDFGRPLSLMYNLSPEFTVRNKSDCQNIEGAIWANLWFNFDTIGNAYVSLRFGVRTNDL